ncbi:MAG: ribonuclease HII [Deltaproteobacteria bacterium]|nr:ribonuclease HII [Deltaproteobacteria bacterium]
MPRSGVQETAQRKRQTNSGDPESKANDGSEHKPKSRSKSTLARSSTSKPESTAAKKLARHETLLTFERELWAENKLVAGIDEAGAGPLAGPVTAACVILDPAQTDLLVGVDDSKRLSAKARTRLATLIETHALAYAVAHASVEEIETINIRQAGILAMQRAFDAASQVLKKGRTHSRPLRAHASVDHILIDARRLPIETEQTELIKGDARSLSIAAASILAKVSRDALMLAADEAFPIYGFCRNMGYGTPEHLRALEAHGASPFHRKTFEPVRSLCSRN